MVYSSAKDTKQSKEPWLAVSLSWLVPGIGQFYARSYTRGVLFIAFVGLFRVFWLASLMLTKCSIISSLAIRLLSLIILPVFACWDAFKLIKAFNTDEFEADRILSKDPWLAVFLSLLLPGLGHAYIRKGFFAVLYVFVFFVLRILSLEITYALVLLSLFHAFVGIHAYTVSPIHRRQRRSMIVIFAILMVSVQCLSRIFIPWATAKYLVMNGPLMGSSMSPTVKSNDRLIINKLAYVWDDPKIGDIVALTISKTDSSEIQNKSCKRVVAIGGESVQIKDGKVYVNGRERRFEVSEDFGEKLEQVEQPFGGGEMHEFYLKFGVDKPYDVPEGCYFLLGDNIRNSIDSRYFGAVPKEEIIGKVVKIYWPFHRIGTLY